MRKAFYLFMTLAALSITFAGCKPPAEMDGDTGAGETTEMTDDTSTTAN